MIKEQNIIATNININSLTATKCNDTVYKCVCTVKSDLIVTNWNVKCIHLIKMRFRDPWDFLAGVW